MTGYTHLETTDRASGEISLTPVGSKHSHEAITNAAAFNNMTVEAAYELLRSGGHLATFGFVRRFIVSYG
jgi:hypothetical protein